MKKGMKIVLIVIAVMLLVAVLSVSFLVYFIKKATHIDYQTFTASDGAEIKYTEMGEGDPIIFIHGYGGSSSGNIALMRKMQSSFRCISFDQRGFGATVGTDNAGIQRSAQDIKELMEYLGLDKVSLFSYSMGGQVAMSYLDQFGTEHIEKVIFGDITPKIVNDDEWKLGLYQGWYRKEDLEKDLDLISSDYEYFWLRLGSQMTFPMNPADQRDFSMTKDDIYAEMAEKMNTDRKGIKTLIDMMIGGEKSSFELQVYRQYWETLGMGDFRGLLPTLDIPVGILYADPGSIYHPATAEYMAEQIPDSILLPMPDSTHGAQVENFAEEILTFYQGTTNRIRK